MDSENYDLDEFLASISFDCLYDSNPNNPSVSIYELDSLHEPQLSLSDMDHNNGLVLKCNGSTKCFTDQDPFFDPLEEQVLYESALTSLCITNNSMENQHSNQVIMAEADFPSSSEVSKNLLEPIDVSEEFLNFTSVDDICQWFDPSQEDNNSNTFLEPMQCDATSFSWKSVMDSYENCLLGSKEPESNLIAPAASSADDTTIFECLSEFDFDVPTMLFSDSSIEELLNCEEAICNNPLNNGSSSVLELSSENNKMEMMENISNPMNFTKNLAWFEARNNLTQPVPDLDTTNKIKRKKVQLGLVMDDSHSIKLGETILVPPRKKEEPKKPSKKKDKAGVGSRPRPKDRQRIQDCIRQLRTIIPGKNVKECSIDNLLECSIRYMSFLSSTAHYANKLQEPDKPKLIEQANGVVLQESSVEGSKYCGTWSFEEPHQTLLCPIIVEDMSHPGQMLIELLCEEEGFSLEMVDTIKGLGLNILKAKMETRNKKLWARFIVEANRHVTKIDVFWSLLHLVEQKNSSGTGMDSSTNNNKYCNVMNDSSVSRLDKQQQEKESCNLFMSRTE
ncbi:hypothetical protein HN51_061703 [Arachis hypogaea]|uniref:BHLH domain-containing protein n=1 Tax=Arachis hypogaea TaxID=3818 RepID=A0A445APF5_ARAHY|nr:Transcription factor LHW [Arachis hypogaea]RYR28319.1 hypothetical protein Ahy_B01g052433 [Arachis hypogaea]